jgi:NADPH:quinone reductase-like Zn-dependent oxidoreductase
MQRFQKAVVQTGYGNAGAVLTWTTNAPVEAPSHTQIQIKVHSASLNPIDWQMIEGNRRLIAKRSFPFVPLFDLAGVVVAVGSAVTRFKVGDAVHADNKIHGGGAAELANVEQDLAAMKPESLTFAEAAAVPLAAQTALLALDKGRVGSGCRICIIGASGGVGSFAVQIAKTLGVASVVGVCSAKNSAFVRSLGADHVVDYTVGKLHEALSSNSINVVLDCVGGREQWLEAQKVLVSGGRFVTISRDEDGKMTVSSAARMVQAILFRQLRSNFGMRVQYIPVFLDASYALLERVDALIRSGQVKVHLDKRYPFSIEGLLQSIEDSKKGRVVGKCVIEIMENT